MLQAVTLSLALVLSSAPADLAPAPALETPAPVECADAKVDQVLAPILVADLGDPIPPDYCFEDCDALPDISCTGSSCSAVSRNCSIGERGYVTCDGNTTYCAEACPECVEDDTRIFHTGICCTCPQRGKLILFQECQGGQWVTYYSECGAPLTCPSC